MTDGISIEPDDVSNETICSCGHPKSSHNLYGCACGCNISSMTLDDFDSLEDEISALRKQLELAREGIIDAMTNEVCPAGVWNILNNVLQLIDSKGNNIESPRLKSIK